MLLRSATILPVWKVALNRLIKVYLHTPTQKMFLLRHWRKKEVITWPKNSHWGLCEEDNFSFWYFVLCAHTVPLCRYQRYCWPTFRQLFCAVWGSLVWVCGIFSLITTGPTRPHTWERRIIFLLSVTYTLHLSFPPPSSSPALTCSVALLHFLPPSFHSCCVCSKLRGAVWQNAWSYKAHSRSTVVISKFTTLLINFCPSVTWIKG